MRKIISILLVMIFLSSNISLAACESCQAGTFCNSATSYNCVADTTENRTKYNYTPDDKSATSNNTTATTCSAYNSKWTASTEKADCGKGYTKDGFSPKTEGTEPTTIWCCRPADPATTTPSTSVMGITCNQEQLVNGQCKLNIYDTLGIRKSVRDKEDATSVGLFVQDVVLSATFFIGTLVTVALIVSGLMFIFAASSGKDPANAKKGIIGSLVGLLIVVSSYVIIRLVQYIAKGF